MLTITRKGSFDAGHRVMNERFKCHNLHGHTYLYELTFKCTVIADIGYTVDFKEIKRVHQQFIDDYFDHAMLINPADTAVVKLAEDLGSKYWIMKGNENYCNPTVENLAWEIGTCMKLLTRELLVEGLKFHSITLYETPNCYAYCDDVFFQEHPFAELCKSYAAAKGRLEYDDRKVN